MRVIIRSILTVAFCSSVFFVQGAKADETLDRIKATKSVNVGFWNEPPYNFTDNGKLTGADVEVMRYVLKKMGVENISGVPQDFSTMIPGLIADRFDINSAFFISPARCKQVQFSAPIWIAQESFIVKAGNPKNLHSYEDLAKDETSKVGLLIGAVEKKQMPKVGVQESQIVTFNDQPSILAALKTGRIDAFVSTSIGNQALLDATGDKELEKADPFTPSIIDGKRDVGYGGFTFRSADKDFVAEFNKYLTAFLGTPGHLALVKPFGFSEADIKPATEMKIETLCKG